MTNNQLRQVHDARPFRPFVFHRADGRELAVKHPEFLARSPSGRTAILYGHDDGFEEIDLLMVATIEAGNGKSHGPRKKRRE